LAKFQSRQRFVIGQYRLEYHQASQSLGACEQPEVPLLRARSCAMILPVRDQTAIACILLKNM
jgi:hypothetical protein